MIDRLRSISISTALLLAGTGLLVGATDPGGPSRPGECLAHLPGSIQWASRHTSPLAVDDTAGPRPESWAPWTHRPSCVEAANDPKVKFCTYTDAGHGPHGFSLITTPEIAAANIDTLQDPSVSSVGAPNLEHWQKLEDDPPYEVVDLPGKGKGVVATRLIKKYDVFMSDSAMFVNFRFTASVRQQDGYDQLHTAAERLRNPHALLSLGRSNTGHQSDIVEDVMRTNSFNLDISGVPHMGMFSKISRVNHACKPNSFMRFSKRSFGATIVAFRDIRPGEEITISYAPFGLTHSQRQSTLADWGFKCTCEMCTAAPDVIAESDARRSKVEDLQAEVLDFLGRGKIHGAIKLIKSILELLETEGLQPLMTEHYDSLARIYWYLNERGKSRANARSAVELLAVHGFIDLKDVDLYVGALHFNQVLFVVRTDRRIARFEPLTHPPVDERRLMRTSVKKSIAAVFWLSVFICAFLAIRNMAAFAGPRYRFTIQPDYFVDYEQVAAQDPSGKATTQPNLGILDREYPEIEIPGTPWERLVTNVTRLNAESRGDVQYKVLFLTRHGLGYHNVQQAKVGTPEWDRYWSRLDGDGAVVWRDAPLVEEGINQAKQLSLIWQDAVANGVMPLPHSFYTSPLTRCLQTSKLVMGPLLENRGHPFRPIVKELLRERMTDHTCDARSTRTSIQEAYPEYIIEPSLTETDELWKADRFESDEEHIARKQRVLEDIFSTDHSQYISLTVHSQAIQAIMQVGGAKPFKIREGTSFAVVMRADVLHS
ncbi:hypothetical protein BN1723_016170 [Verticillium longisporum]|uniref:SET domain-containing protein n=1 Tax=Verticillium longisporum TaxID=100787 RepID=A0A0G4NA72_VERLO|nr:phosphoglycerate mutase like protein [Verticillium longisporum]CRK14317.1 hypothetical protein BN1708_002595 [Verticillium longisporum]CRK43347.1 hypothetical protein BN1723_016170 [Verticillium longisporum]